MRKLLVVIAVIVALALGSWLYLRTSEASKSRSGTTSGTAAPVEQVPSADLARLEKGLNNTSPTKQAKAFLPGLLREAYRAQHKKATKPLGRITLYPKTFNLIKKDIGSIEMDIPKAGRKTVGLVKFDGQWFVTAIQE
jgi:hypothetical protein